MPKLDPNVANDGLLNLDPPPAPVRPRLTPRDADRPAFAKSIPAGPLRSPPGPLCRTLEQDEEDAGPYAPRSAEQCLEGKYASDRNFHKRGTSPFQREEYDKSSPSRHAILTNRWNSRVKRPQQPVEAKRQVHCDALLFLGRTDAADGDVNFFSCFSHVRDMVAFLEKTALKGSGW